MAILISQNQRSADRRVREFARRRCPGILGVLLFLLSLGLPGARGQTVSHEYPLKTAFLLNFARFTDWPTNAFAAPDSPFVFGILGDNPFGPLLGEAVRDELIDGRKCVVKHYRRADEIKGCHILFISQSEAGRLDKIIADLKGKPVLSVSDIDGSAYREVCVRFITENNKIRFRINKDALKEANLTVSSQMLRLAEVISPASK